ncbi:MAG: nucleotidyltransferase family protein [Desulfuromonadaceae bacterium]|nr:nucleotidyltransferase family protein [Desulfuromonadaceae bacterium]
MRAVGLITEYNLFHNGHAYHARQARLISGADAVVAVMSGHFLQRGEPALVDKWTRAAMALKNGVDVVVELPFPWACNSAPHFARGALECLQTFGPRLDSFCFGSESGDLAALQHQARVLSRLEAQAELERPMRRGLNWPQARALRFAAETASRTDGVPDLALPNNVLGLAYLQALETLPADSLRPLTIQRIGSHYHDRFPGTGSIASATAVRALLEQGRDVRPYLPETAWALLQQGVRETGLLDCQRWWLMQQTACLGPLGPLNLIYQQQPGLSERMQQVALAACDADTLVAGLKARHLTRTRIQRLLCYAALSVSADEMADLLAKSPPFLILLGTTAKGEQFLSQCRKSLSVPLVGNFSRLISQLKRCYGADSPAMKRALALLDLHNRATRCYTLLLPKWQDRSRHWDYVRSPWRSAAR